MTRTIDPHDLTPWTDPDYWSPRRPTPAATLFDLIETADAIDHADARGRYDLADEHRADLYRLADRIAGPRAFDLLWWALCAAQTLYTVDAVEVGR